MSGILDSVYIIFIQARLMTYWHVFLVYIYIRTLIRKLESIIFTFKTLHIIIYMISACSIYIEHVKKYYKSIFKMEP